VKDRRFGCGKSYPIPVWSGLLEHRKRMGSAIWEFIWCLDKITREHNEENGRMVGVILGGKPVKAEEIARDLKESAKTVERHLRRLVKNHYLLARRTPYGLVLSVTNSQKFGIWSRDKRSDKNVPSENETRDKSIFENGHNGPPRRDTIVLSKEDSAVDSAIDAAAWAHTQVTRSLPALEREAEARETWARTRTQLRQDINPHNFSTWIQPLVPLGFSSDGSLILATITETCARNLRSKYMGQIAEAVGHAVRFVVDEQAVGRGSVWTQASASYPVSDRKGISASI